MKVAQLPAALRSRADEVRRYSQSAAEAFTEAAEILERTLREDASELLNLEDAARESGYSAAYLGELLRDRKLPNAGRPNAPKIRRADLPRKAGHAVAARGRTPEIEGIGSQARASRQRR